MTLFHDPAASSSVSDPWKLVYSLSLHHQPAACPRCCLQRVRCPPGEAGGEQLWLTQCRNVHLQYSQRTVGRQALCMIEEQQTVLCGCNRHCHECTFYTNLVGDHRGKEALLTFQNADSLAHPSRCTPRCFCWSSTVSLCICPNEQLPTILQQAKDEG